MRLLKISCIAGFVLAASGAAACAEGLYASGQLGFSWGGGAYADGIQDLELDTGLVVSGAIGTDLGNVRVEGELAYRQNDIDNVGGFPVTGEMTSLALMANLFYDFGDGSGFTPYIGIGLGAAAVTMESVDLFNVDDSDTTFALQFMLGGSFPISENLLMTVELRAFGAVPQFVDIIGPFDQPYGVGSLSLGLRASF